jgi:hypothetical protein
MLYRTRKDTRRLHDRRRTRRAVIMCKRSYLHTYAVGG